MPISIANLIPTSPPVAASAPSTTRQTSGTGSSEPFQTVLADARAETRSAVAADDVNRAEAAAEFAQAEVTDDEADDALAAELAGVLVAAQFGVPTTPLDLADANAVAAGQLTPEALNGVTPELTTNQSVPPTRANPLFRQFVAEGATQNNTRLATPVTQDTTPETTPTPTAPVVPQNAIPTLPEPQVATAPLPSSVASVQPGQRQVVVPQAPIIPGLIPPPPTTGATETPTPITATQGPIEATAVPEARVGDRPGTAGEQFAAIASAASTLTVAPTTQVAPPDFAPIVAEVTPVEAAAPTPTAPTPPTTTARPLTPTTAVVPTEPTVVPNTTPTAPAPATNVVPATNNAPPTNNVPVTTPATNTAPVANVVPAPAPAPVRTPTAPAPIAPTSNVAPPVTEPVDTLTPTAVPSAAPVPAPAPTAFVPVLATDSANTTTAPVLTRPDVVEPKAPESDFGDAARTSGVSSGTPAPFSPNSTAPRATNTVQPPAPAVQVADGIITHAHIVERTGTTEFQIRLDPPELGPVRIRLTQSGDGINGQVVVSDDAIRRMIESQLPELRQRLEAAGVTLQSFDVTTDANTGNTGRNPYRSDAPTGAAPPGATATAATPRGPPGRRGPGVLDVMA